jgi:hypothetical protein
MSIRPNTTCDIYRAGNTPPASPTITAVPCCFISCFDIGRERGEKEALQYRFTARMLVAPATDVRDDFSAWTGSPSSQDTVYVPNEFGVGYHVVFVERINRGQPADALCVYLDRLSVLWPYPGPAVLSLSPNHGGTTGGTTVTITGRGFTGATALLFGSTAAGSFSVNSDTQITAVSPAESSGIVDVTVTTPLGSSSTYWADQFAFAGPFFKLGLNHSNQYADMGNPTALQITGPLTLSVWVDIPAFGTQQSILAKFDFNAGVGYQLWMDSGTTLNFTISGTSLSTQKQPGFTTGLHHVVGTWDGTTQSLYVDGVLQQSTTPSLTITDSGNDFLVGADLSGSGASLADWLGGTIDAVRIYDTALTAGQVVEIYGAGSGLATPGSAGANLVGWWKFDEGAGSTAIDSSGSGNNGMLVNSPTYGSASVVG